MYWPEYPYAPVTAARMDGLLRSLVYKSRHARHLRFSHRCDNPVGAVLSDFAIDCRTLILPPPRGNAVASI